MEECLQECRDLWNIGWLEKWNSSAARFWRVETTYPSLGKAKRLILLFYHAVRYRGHRRALLASGNYLNHPAEPVD
jgi:hypothetical protein